MRLLILVTVNLLSTAVAFAVLPSDIKHSSRIRRFAWNPLKELGDMLNNFDDIAEDFFYKRMGNGEVFYGKRKYKPSAAAEENNFEYNGMGLSDHSRIEAARERKAEFLAERQSQLAEE